MVQKITTEINYSLSQRINHQEDRTTTIQQIIQAEQAFEKLIAICQSKTIQLKLEDLQQFYTIQIYNIGSLAPHNVRTIYEEIINMLLNFLFRYKNSKTKRNWFENELRVFIWILFYFSQTKRLPIQKFGDEEWNLIKMAFIGKSISDVKFQWLILSKSTPTSSTWTTQEDHILETLMNKPEYHNKWIEIAKQLYQKSKQGHFRKPKQCRERWKNYLDPSIQKGQWSSRQDKKLFEYVLKLGKKWSIISKILQTRTQHSVKNRYKSLLKKYKKDHSIRQKPKSSKGLHTKELQYIGQIIKQIKQKIALFEDSEQSHQSALKQQMITTKLQVLSKQIKNQSGQQENSQRRRQEQDKINIPISPGNHWNRNFPVMLTIIQSPIIITPQILSPVGFRFPVTMWQQDNAQLFYS